MTRPAHPAADPAVGARILSAWRDGDLVPRGPGSPAPEPSEPAEASVIGIGESFVAWAVRAPGRAGITVRVPWRDPEDLAQPLGPEIAALRHVPPGLGPLPLALWEDPATSPIGRPCLVTAFVPGRVLPPSGWTGAHVRAHGRALARLHASPMPGRGRLGGRPDAASEAISAPASGGRPDPGQAAHPDAGEGSGSSSGSGSGPRNPAHVDTAALVPGPMSILGEVDGAFGWWREHHPGVAGRADLAPLLAAARARCAGAEPAFAADGTFVLAHGDLCATNVVWTADADGAPHPRFIDFEWAQADDRARDLAIIGGAVHGGPWYVPLDDAGLADLLDTYVAAARALDPGAIPDVAALRVRRDAWVAYERTAMLLHVARRAGEGDPVHRAALPVLRSTLAAWLGA